jgi:DNA-binding NarL/FixJ family response regulator
LAVCREFEHLPLDERQRAPPFSAKRRRRGVGVTAMSWPETVGMIPARILVVGDDLLTGALTSALGAHGFRTMHVPQCEPRINRGIDWRPNLVILDAGSLEPEVGAALVGTFGRAGLRVCVIDAVAEDRLRVWNVCGVDALVDRNAPFDELFGTVNRLLRKESREHSVRPASASPVLTSLTESSFGSSLEPFALLTEREQFVLAELIEGHCAEEIAGAAYVSISTVRSHIKSILQKLGVSSQLAAVALARRAGWRFEESPVKARRESGGRRAHAR